MSDQSGNRPPHSEEQGQAMTDQVFPLYLVCDEATPLTAVDIGALGPVVCRSAAAYMANPQVAAHLAPYLHLVP
jgi:hypothetical protein